MEATNSLMGILTHLQSMENRFSMVLMEAALKLMDFSQAKIFFLVESEGQTRYYGGKGELCEKFRRGHLIATPADIEMQVDANISSLSQKHTVGGDWDFSASSTALRSAHPSSPSVPTTVDRDGALIPDSRFQSVPTRRSSPLGQKRKLSSANSAADSCQTAQKSLKVEVKEEITNKLDKDADEILIDDDEDDVLVEDYASLTPVDLAPNHVVNDGPASDVAAWVMGQLEADRTTMKKLEAVKSMTNPEVLQETDSVERKIVVSLFYSLGSLFAGSFLQGGADKHSREMIFQKVWQLFPNFRSHENLKIPRKDGSIGNFISRCKDSFTAPYRMKKFKEKNS